MRIIIVTGLICSGKGEVSKRLVEKHGFRLLDHSEIMEEMLREEGRLVTRGEKRKLRLERGNTFTAEEIVRRIKNGRWSKVVVGSSRRVEEYLLLKKTYPETRLLVVEAEEGKRFERSLRRAQYSDTPRTLEEFREQDRREEEIYGFRETFRHADFRIRNEGSLEELWKKVDRVAESQE